MVLTFTSVDKAVYCVTIQMEAIEKYFNAVLFYYAVQGGSNF